jgi:hypothetical protein
LFVVGEQVTLCNLSTLLPLGFLFLLDEVVDDDVDAAPPPEAKSLADASSTNGDARGANRREQ